MTGAQTLQQIVDGLDGVTEGPWKVYNGCSWWRIGREGGSDCAVVYPYTNHNDGHPEMGSTEGYHVANFEHIARCDPDAIRSIAASFDALKAENARLRRELDALKIGEG